MKKDKVSSAVIRRLPWYHHHLSDLYPAGVERILSNALSKSTGLTALQIRQDLSCLGGFGQQGYGYNTKNLRGGISDTLGMNRSHNTIILGAGNLGRTLIENFRFERSGVTLSATFDMAPGVIGQRLSGVLARYVDQLEEYLGQRLASIGVLTVPRSVANRVTGRLMAFGVKGVWSFTNIKLTVDAPDIVIENIHFVDSLLVLGYMISEIP